ncbi:MAG: ABC transporter ATP-binding protein [Actinomycetota bacterium]
MSEVAIVTELLGKKFGSHWAVKSLNLKISQGSVYGLLGRNGAGKSTTMDLLSGVLKATEGSAVILGHNLARERGRIVNEIAYINQAKTLYGHLTVDRMVQLARGLSRNWSEALAAKYIKLPGKSRISSLSKGQAVQLAFGLAAARRARVLLIDEPTANLDPIAVQRVLRGLIEDCVAEGATVLIASHQLDEIAQVCDRAGLLEDGHLLHEVAVDDIDAMYRVITAVQESADVTGPGIIKSRRVNGTARYLVCGSVPEITGRLTSGGAKILDVRPATLRTLYMELLDDAEETSGLQQEMHS